MIEETEYLLTEWSETRPRRAMDHQNCKQGCDPTVSPAHVWQGSTILGRNMRIEPSVVGANHSDFLQRKLRSCAFAVGSLTARNSVELESYHSFVQRQTLLIYLVQLL
jgi:hypothetical protein